MADDTIDLLKIKIETAKRELPLETINAINAVDWRAAILSLREKHGYTFEQLGDLELETELVLCGLVNPADYQKELETRMGISRAAANELVNEMNEMVFKKIREELIKNTERKKIFANKITEGKETKTDTAILSNAGIEIIEKNNLLPEIPGVDAIINAKREEILKKIEKPASSIPVKPAEIPVFTSTQPVKPATTEVKEVNPLIAQKLSSAFQVGVVKTEHTLDNITKVNAPSPVNVKNKIPGGDPYRELPE